MENPIVLITGALTGIGRAAALAFAKDGARVVISGRRDEAGQKLLAELRDTGVEAEFWRADVRHEEDVRDLVDKTVARFGRLDVAVNGAGIEGKPGPVTEQTAESYAATFDTNVLGTLLSMKHELRAMLPRRHGSIINVSSNLWPLGRRRSVALCGQQARGRGAYAIGGPRGCGIRRARQRRCSRTDRHRSSDPLYRECRTQSRLSGGSPTATRGQARRNCPIDRFSRIRQGVLQHRSNFRRRWRQDGAIKCSAPLHDRTERNILEASDGSRKYQSYCADGQ